MDPHAYVDPQRIPRRKTAEPTVGQEKVKSVQSTEGRSGGTNHSFASVIVSALLPPVPHFYSTLFTLHNPPPPFPSQTPSPLLHIPTKAIGPRFVFHPFLCLPSFFNIKKISKVTPLVGCSWVVIGGVDDIMSVFGGGGIFSGVGLLTSYYLVI